ncbi:hypothetical protein Dimus_018025 [Dionaea muscipula]
MLVACVNDDEMKVKVVEQNISPLNEEDQLFGIDDVDAFIDIVVKKTINDIFEDISDKVNMDLAKEVIKELEDKEAANKEEPEEKEDADAEIAPPQDDVALTTSRYTDGEAIGMKIVVFQAPTSATNPESTPAPSFDSNFAYVDMPAHIEQAVKCLLSAIEEQSTGMKNLLKHLEFHGSQDGKVRADMYLHLGAIIDIMDTLN